MLRSALRRALWSTLTVLTIAVVGFVVLHARTDGVLTLVCSERGARTPEACEAIGRSLGLDRPLVARLGSWLSGVAQGDLGASWSRPGRRVAGLLREALPTTLALTGLGLLLQLGIGTLVASVSIRRPGGWRDGAVNGAALTFSAMPEFCLALLLLVPLSVELRWFPLGGIASAPWELGPGLLERAADRVRHLVLPVLCLGLGGAAIVARMLRTRWLQELGERYVTGARARGLDERRIVWWHALRSASGPLCSAVGLSLPALVGGAVVVEQVFDYPGMGNLLVQAVAARDLPLIAGTNVLLGALVAAGGLLADLLWMLADPRARPS